MKNKIIIIPSSRSHSKVVAMAFFKMLQERNVSIKIINGESYFEILKKLATEVNKSALSFEKLGAVLNDLKSTPPEEKRSVIPPAYNKKKFGRYGKP